MIIIFEIVGWYDHTKGISLYPRSTEGGMGVYWIHPDVCPSACPSVCRHCFRNFLKKLLAQFISYLAFTLLGLVSWPQFIFVFLALFFAPGGQIFGRKWGFPNILKKLLAQFSVLLKNSHLCSTRLQNKNLYWIFLDEVGSDQSGGILSPFMGTACSNWGNFTREMKKTGHWNEFYSGIKNISVWCLWFTWMIHNVWLNQHFSFWHLKIREFEWCCMCYVPLLMPSHWLNQCWLLGNWILRNKLQQWNLH